HTNDAAGAVVRLRDMGVEPFLLASTLRLIIAQRLVRRLCEHCRTPEPADAAAAALVGIEPGETLYRPVGCSHCAHTGYQGRIGIYEALRVDDRLRRLIGGNATEQEITAAGLDRDLGQEARRYILAGLTTVEEALRITGQGARDGDL
ncbi:MAG TPA: ATPase, T2SS/T4P/T4SS family, partial [Caulobacter sp.]|nr:ATPase, T2SS/T4P/T4SS family [Caulobacter sp.]